MKINQFFVAGIFFLIGETGKSQPVPNGNILNPTLGKFEGTWQWANGTDTVRIVLRKENILLPFPENSRTDAIIGFHLYKRSNSTIEGSINHINTSHSDKLFTMLGTNDNSGDTLFCSLKDISKNKFGSLNLVLKSGRNELKWTLRNREGVKIGPFDYGFTLPLSLVLRKL